MGRRVLEKKFVGAALSLIAGLAASDASAQSVTDILRQGLRDAAADSNLGSGLQSLSIFSVTPGISTAVFHSDSGDPSSELRIESYKLPLSYEFQPVFAGLRPYAELTFGYVNADEKDKLDLVPGQPAKVDAEFDAYSMLGGVGTTIPITGPLSLRPIMLVGYSRLEGDGDFDGPFSEELQDASSGLIRNLRINTALAGGALQAIVERRRNDAPSVSAEVRYNHLYARSFDASDSVLETSDDFGVLTSNVEVSGPTGLRVIGRDTRWIAFLGNTYLPVGQRQEESSIGFDYFFEIGGGWAVMESDVVEGVAGLSLRGSFIIGEDVKGWSLGLSLEF